MLFRYWEVVDHGQTRLLPLLRVRVHGAADAIDLFALVDSGAEQNVFGDDVAERLGIELEDGEPVTIVGVGNQEMPGRRVEVHFQLGKHHWVAPTVFSAAVRQRHLLGQTGFFSFFNVTFRYQREEMEIRRVRS